MNPLIPLRAIHQSKHRHVGGGHVVHGQAPNLLRINRIDPRIADVKQQGGAAGGDFEQNQGTAGFQPRRLELPVQPPMQRVQAVGNRSQLHGGRQVEQALDGFFGRLPAMAVAAHAVEHGQPPMTGRPIGQAQFGFPFPPQQASPSLIINDEVIVLIFLASMPGGRA